MKENGGVIPVDKIASIKNAKPKPQSVQQQAAVEPENVESYVPESAGNAVAGGVAALGSQTISELVAMKAKQREQRQIKMDDIIKKNKLENQKDKVQSGGINEVFQKVISARRTDMTLSDSDDDGFD